MKNWLLKLFDHARKAVSALRQSDDGSHRAQLTYTSPDEQACIVDPTAEQMAKVILTEPYSYWRKGGSGEGTLSINHKLVFSITSPELGHFFFIRFHTRPMVPYDGTPCSEYVDSDMGGEPFRIPYACMVTPEVAVEIVSAFIRTRELPATVKWVMMADVPFGAQWHDG